jgi:hypothetical protein
MPTAAVSDSRSTFDIQASPAPFLKSPLSGPDQQLDGSIVALTPSEAEPPRAVGTAVLPAGASESRSITHVYEPIRNEHNDVIDFRLTFDAVGAHEARRPFLGIHMVRTGDWAAPGAIFHTLKRVLDSGQSLHEMTRHVGVDQEVCFYQTANRVGDTVVTTTSIVVMVPRLARHAEA